MTGVFPAGAPIMGSAAQRRCGCATGKGVARLAIGLRPRPRTALSAGISANPTRLNIIGTGIISPVFRLRRRPTASARGGGTARDTAGQVILPGPPAEEVRHDD